MTETDFWAAIDAAPTDRFVAVEVVDWGSMPRGAGKRHGRMVMGGMSDPPRGKKTYANILGKADLTADQRVEASGLVRAQQLMFARALAAGFSADVAFMAAYTVGPEPITRSEAFQMSKGNGYL